MSSVRIIIADVKISHTIAEQDLIIIIATWWTHIRMANGQWPAASGGQCWRLVANGCQWRPQWSLICAFLVPSWRLQFLLQGLLPFIHNYELINCHWQVANVANVTNVATVAKMACVVTVAIVNACKCQCHRHYHHDVYE